MVRRRRLLHFLQTVMKIWVWFGGLCKVCTFTNGFIPWMVWTNLISLEQLEGLSEEEAGQKDFKDMIGTLLQFVWSDSALWRLVLGIGCIIGNELLETMNKSFKYWIMVIAGLDLASSGCPNDHRVALYYMAPSSIQTLEYKKEGAIFCPCLFTPIVSLLDFSIHLLFSPSLMIDQDIRNTRLTDKGVHWVLQCCQTGLQFRLLGNDGTQTSLHRRQPRQLSQWLNPHIIEDPRIQTKPMLFTKTSSAVQGTLEGTLLTSIWSKRTMTNGGLEERLPAFARIWKIPSLSIILQKWQCQVLLVSTRTSGPCPVQIQKHARTEKTRKTTDAALFSPGRICHKITNANFFQRV